MKSAIRRKLEMAARVRSFCRDHPAPGDRYASTLARFEDRLARAEALLTQQRTGTLSAHASTQRRAELRQAIRDRPLKHLVRIAGAASREEPVLRLRFRLPRKPGTHLAFLAAARSMAAEAASRKDLFISFGMAPTFLDDLDSALAEYEKALHETHAATASRIGARADLETLTTEILGLVHEFDAINQNRFEADSEQLAAWNSARNVAWPNRPQAPAETKPGDAAADPAA